MKIGELARKTNTPVETIRFYEREGLMPAPVRSEGNYRIYDQHHMQRLAFIRRCRALDMTLQEVRALLALMDQPDSSCEQANQLLDEHIEHVTRRIAELTALKHQLSELRALCDSGHRADQCGILNALTTSPSPDCPPDSSHVPGSHCR
ncbi:MAG TPA: Cd(II)/Pb(II)-responsive transcriptional regulator [Aquabacterium sp.]|uniref:Cd(II)/Pb(II)-responsive transcriptional regulator n=1 Tax=Aquabacterium sp. TaxID=1872578 RepID=UPI002E302C1C|nr:Cd(II)/Pb(II)-responsive transcriptional regulator [Aquabacterium sp.]HEX5373531.1 Cd(II)/Pb(II)-responsive transcriptional regulator [Aquabacterium sp.]